MSSIYDPFVLKGPMDISDITKGITSKTKTGESINNQILKNMFKNPLGDFKTNFNFNSVQGVNNIASLGNIGLNLLDNNVKLFRNDYSGKRGNIAKGIDAGFDAATSMVSTFNPVLGMVMKAGSMIGGALGKIGGATDKMTTFDSIFGSKILGGSPITLINNLTGKHSDTLLADEQVMSSSSYGDTVSDINNALQYSNKKYGGFSSGARKKANKTMALARNDQFKVKGILNEADEDFSKQFTSQDMLNNKKQLKMSGSMYYNPMVGKNGFKFIKDFREFKSKQNKSQNLLPTGALHARKHNISKDGVVTNKGIPVLMENGGKPIQVAEIEKEEIVFRKEVTDKLEKLYKLNTPESAIEAGKLLTYEILENTKDEGNFIKTIE